MYVFLDFDNNKSDRVKILSRASANKATLKLSKATNGVIDNFDNVELSFRGISEIDMVIEYLKDMKSRMLQKQKDIVDKRQLKIQF